MNKRYTFCALFLFHTFTFAQAPEDFDSSFNSVGYYINTIDSGIINTNAIALQSSGKIITAGTLSDTLSNVFFIDRYLNSGIPDISFGSSGRITVPLIGTNNLTDMVIQTDDKIVVCGYFQSSVSNMDLILVRFKSNGDLDSTFGVNGIVIEDLNTGNNDLINHLLLQPDGKLIATGKSFNSTLANNDYCVARFLSNGILDTSFNSTGINIFNYWGEDVSSQSSLQPDGKIVIFGNSFGPGWPTYTIARLTASGLLDTSFVSGSFATQLSCLLCVEDYGKSIIAQSDGKFLLAGHAMDFGGQIYLTTMRYNADLSLDLTFNGSGYSIPSLTTNFAENTDILLQANNKTLVSGNFYNPSTFVYNNPGILRYNSNGTPDSSFANGSYAFYSFMDAPETMRDIDIQTDGKIIFTGETYDSTTMSSYSYLARLNGDGTLLNNIEKKLKSEFSIHPNPTTGFLNISSNSIIEKINILNSTGQTIFSSENIHSINTQLDLTNIVDGIYLIKIISLTHSEVKKIIKN